MIAFLLVLMLQLRVPDAEQVVGPPAGTPVTGAALDRREAEIAALLRCPVCQGLAIGDSPSVMAANMKQQVRELLSRGYSEQQILRYFEHSYGQFVLLRPKFEGMGALVWLLPITGLLLGGAIVVLAMKKLLRDPAKGSPAAVEVTAGDPAAEASDDYLARVRELVEKEP